MPGAVRNTLLMKPGGHAFYMVGCHGSTGKP